MLAREVLRLRGTLTSREAEWDVMTDLYFYRDPEAEENKEATEEVKVPGVEETAAPVFDGGADWEVPGPQGGAFAPPAASGAPGGSWDTDQPEWTGGAAAPAATGDWSADPPAEAAAAPTW